jgi:hypothetical protein
MQLSNRVAHPSVGNPSGVEGVLASFRSPLMAKTSNSPKKETPFSGGVGYGRWNELLRCSISIRGQERTGLDGRPAFFREASDICDQSV